MYILYTPGFLELNFIVDPRYLRVVVLLVDV